MYVLGDGMENDSHLVTRPEFRDKLATLADNWTVATLVPNMQGVKFAQELGFPAGNIDKWDTASSTGSVEALSNITRSVGNFMEARQDAKARGVSFTSTRNIFSMTPDTLNQGNIYKAGLRPLADHEFYIYQNT